MTKKFQVIFTALILIIGSAMTASAVDEAEVRGPVAAVVDGAVYTWGPQDFAGFFYDINGGLGQESITLTITGDSLDEPEGVVYETRAQQKDFELGGWGRYWTIAFLGEEYFAAYVDGSILFDESTDEDLMVHDQLSKVLYNDDQKRTFTIETPLQLEEGYELAIQAIDLDGNKVYLQLMKDGNVVDSAVVEPSKDGATMQDKTFTYKKNLGRTEKIVVIAVHFKNIIQGADTDLATVDGIWQISDTFTDIEEDTEYDKMTIQTVDADTKTIMMNNEENEITLNKKKDTTLMEKARIRTADQEATAEDPLRFYIYQEITEPGTYEVRGKVAEVVDGATYTWGPQEFSGFYYEIDDDLGDEKITMTITDGALEEPNGVVYTTEAKQKEFELEEWGTCWYIGFLGEEYLTAYSEGRLADDSADTDLMKNKRLSKILIDDDEERTITSGLPLKLGDGYEIVTPLIDAEKRLAIVQLMRGGRLINFAAVDLSGDKATAEGKTYTYKKNLAGTGEMVVLAVHFKNIIQGADTDLATVDAIWQISDRPIDISAGAKYDKMTIQAPGADEMTITMKNEGNKIILNPNEDQLLMRDIRIKTADQDVISAEEPLRFYIYKDSIYRYSPAGSAFMGLIIVPYKSEILLEGTIERGIERIADERAEMRNGTVILFDHGSGYIFGDDEKYYYFDEDGLGEETSISKGDKVSFEAYSSEIGPEARKVRRIY